MMRTILIYFFAVSSFFLCFSVQGQTQPTVARDGFTDMEYAGKSSIVGIIDAYTLQLKDKRYVHLTGIDIPDFDTQNPGPLTLTAIEVLKDSFNRRDVDLFQTRARNTGRKNRMGHALFHITRSDDSLWAQGLLLRLGLARVRTTHTNAQMAKEMYAMEKLARKENLGLWALENNMVVQADNAISRHNQYAIVEGIVKRAVRKQNLIYLNFSDNWREDFTIQIAPSDLRKFRRKGIDPLQLQGQKLRVRGWVKSYNGPYIKIDHPERLELLETENINR